MIQIAIDGPGGAGKSTYAKKLASILNFVYVDTGALYRSVGLYVRNRGFAKDDKANILSCLPAIHLDLSFENGTQSVILNGKTLGNEIRTGEISMYASAVSAIPEVREFLLETQRRIAEEHNVIMDGRDIGTVILPMAQVKIFLFAKPETRAKRRYEELLSKGIPADYDTVLSEMIARDKADREREIAPCVPADDAVSVDNSDMTIEECTDVLLGIIRKKTGV